jgi:hypothetical protein
VLSNSVYRRTSRAPYLGGCFRMYRDVVQWSKIRHRILVQGHSIRRVASEKSIDPRTIRKMLDHALLQPYGPRAIGYPKPLQLFASEKAA